MKKWIFIWLLLGFAFTVNAQQGDMTNPNGLTIDTFTNTTAEGPYARIPGSDIKAVGFTIDLTSIDGTVAGKIYLQGATKSGKWAYPYLDSITLAPGSNVWQMDINGPPGFQYIRMLVVPTGTQNTAYQATYYIRK